MFKLFESRAITVKIEGTEGTDAVPTGAADAQLTFEGSCEVEYDRLDRVQDKPFLGANRFKLINKRVRIKFTSESLGAATVGNASPLSPLLRAGGRAEVLTGATRAAYNPISVAMPSVTVYFYWADLLFKCLGSRLNMRFVYDIDSYPKIEVEIMGFAAVATVAEIAAPTMVLTAFREPPVITAETFLVTVNGVTVECFGVNSSMGNGLEMRHHSEARRIQIGTRSMEGSLIMDPLALASFNPWALAEAATNVPIISLVDGGASFKVRHTFAQAQLMAPKKVEKAKGLAYEIPFVAKPSATGNDDDLLEYE